MPFHPVGGEWNGVTLEEMKQYLRVDYEDDDQLITGFIASAEQLCGMSSGLMKQRIWKRMGP